jgi:RNA polymerase sigma-70 factor (ECF subfamily)
LLDIAFRMTGSVAEAEDVVQDAFTRLLKVDMGCIGDVRAWLVVVVTRLCLDRVRTSTRQRAARASLLDPMLAVPAQDPADRATLDDNIRVALNIVVNRLSPAERTVFVLHDVFQYRFDEVADIVGRSPAACRQLASRARRAIVSDNDVARFEIQSPEQGAITQQFLEACSTGDVTSLLVLLDHEVDAIADVGAGGGVDGRGGIVTVRGAHAVAEATLRYLGPNSRSVLLSVPAGDGGQLVAVCDRRPIALVSLQIRTGLIHHIDAIADQDKLLPLAPALGL